jgi:hemolysin activation/secretion protein
MQGQRDPTRIDLTELLRVLMRRRRAQQGRRPGIREQLLALEGPHQPDSRPAAPAGPQPSIKARRMELMGQGLSHAEAMQQMADEGLVSPRLAQMFQRKDAQMQSEIDDL